MQTFAEFMAESFRSNTPLTWNLASTTQASASFNIDSIKVVVFFEQSQPAGAWQVLFEVDKGERTEVAYSSFSIFNGVFQAVQEFIEVREPEMLTFATKRDDLAGIYQTYLRREAAALEKLGYKLERPQPEPPFTEFMLRRMKPSAWK
jgi:hypothetical protein